MKKISLAFGCLILLVLGAAGCSNPHVAVVSKKNVTLALVKVQVADTPAQRQIGLMYRKHLDRDAGMIFVFPTAKPVRFWMKNTEIPLDMIFVNGKDRIIGIVANASPYSERLLTVEGDSKYVLEVNAGFCKRFGIKAGDKIEFRGFKPYASE